MRIGYMYDVASDRPWFVVQWCWLTRKDRPNAPTWWHGGYSRHFKLFPANASWRARFRTLMGKG